jgi:hypothetical protein
MIQKNHIVALFAGIACLLLTAYAETVAALGARPSVVYVVNSDDDVRSDGCDTKHCNLREAITAANRHVRQAHIRFNLPAPPYRIAVRSALPPLRGDIVLDGVSQVGTDCPIPMVQLDGSMIKTAGVNGLVVAGNRNTVRGLVISHFSGHGVVVRGDENTLQCLFVGTDETGMHPAGNGGDGIVVESGRSNRIGGSQRTDGNLISSNAGIGLRLRDALATEEQFNYIGVDILGQPKLPNGNADPEADLPPPRSTLPPPVAARFDKLIEATVSLLGRQYEAAVARSGLIARYAALLGPNVPVQPTSILELTRLLAPHPELFVAFTAEISALIEREQERAASLLEAVQILLRRSNTFLREQRPFGAPDPLVDQVALADPDDLALSGPPSTALAVRIADPPLFPLSPFLFSHLQTYGPTSFGGDILEAVEFACPGPAPCQWPIVYDLRPRVIDLVWETDLFTTPEVTDMVEEDGYFFSVYLNGALLLKGPQFGMAGDTGLSHYWAVRLPSADCPNLNRCVVVQVGLRDRLPGVPLPWTFELRIEKLEDLDIPIIQGIDEFGNPIVIRQEAVVINRSFKTFNPNATNDESWFVTAMEETFRSARCVQCHSFGTIEAVEAHHTVIGGTFGDAVLIPSLFVPGAHVITCSNCHWMPLTNDYGTPFHEIEWRVPYVDLNVNWSTKTAQQICARVKSNLPTKSLRHLHFHGDARLFWAVEYFNGIDPLPKAEPMNYDEFLRRFDAWNLGGTPCP